MKFNKNFLNKTALTICLYIFMTQLSYAQLSYDTLNAPLKDFYRLGTTNIPEQRIKESTQRKVEQASPKEIKKVNKTSLLILNKKTKESNSRIQAKNYADFTIKQMSLEISDILDSEFDDMQADLSLLWQGTAVKSDTIKFAIYKLSNPDKDKPDNNAIKNVLTTIAGMSSFIGAGTGNPILASAALIGGNTLGIMSQDPKALNYKYTQVNDADMIILVRKVDELQQKLVNMYYEYMLARKKYNLLSKIVENYEANYNSVQNESSDIIIVADTFYRMSLDDKLKAQTRFLEKRANLEQFVGNDILEIFEQNLKNRE